MFGTMCETDVFNPFCPEFLYMDNDQGIRFDPKLANRPLLVFLISGTLQSARKSETNKNSAAVEKRRHGSVNLYAALLWYTVQFDS